MSYVPIMDVLARGVFLQPTLNPQTDNNISIAQSQLLSPDEKKGGGVTQTYINNTPPRKFTNILVLSKDTTLPEDDNNNHHHHHHHHYTCSVGTTSSQQPSTPTLIQYTNLRTQESLIHVSNDDCCTDSTFITPIGRYTLQGPTRLYEVTTPTRGTFSRQFCEKLLHSAK